MNKQFRLLLLWTLRVIEILADEKRAFFNIPLVCQYFNEFDGYLCYVILFLFTYLMFI